MAPANKSGVKTRLNSAKGSGDQDQIAELLEEINFLKKENQSLHERLDKVEKIVMVLEKEKKQSERKVVQAVKATLEKEGSSYVDKLKKNLGESTGKVIAMKQFADMQDRRMNLVFRGIGESKEVEGQLRKQHDRREILKVAEAAGIDRNALDPTIVTVRRLGRYDAEKEQRRPLLVKLTSQEMRETALRGNGKLKELNEKNRKTGCETRYRIDPDMSKEQMQTLDTMWEKAKDMTKKESKNGLIFYVVGKENPVIRKRLITEEEKARME